jgi:hypothetical protein
MKTARALRIVEATPEHAPFLASVCLTASRSHLAHYEWYREWGQVIPGFSNRVCQLPI